MLNKLDYSYNDGESIVHKLNPVVKIVGLVVYVLLCLLEFNNYLFIASLGVVFLLLLLSNIRMFKYFKIVWNLKFILLTMYIFMLHKNIAYVDINTVVFRFVFLVLYLMMIIYTTTKKDLAKAIAIVVDIFNLIGISFKKITGFFINIFMYPSMFLDTYIELFTNLELKGKDYSHCNIFGKFLLLLKNIRIVYKKTNNKMKIRKMNMKYRLYKSNVKSEYKYRNKLCIFDYLFIIFNIGMLVFYVLKVRL